MKAPAHLRDIDGWTFKRADTADGITSLRYTRPEADDTAIIAYREGEQLSKAKVVEGLQKLMDRGPPSAHA